MNDCSFNNESISTKYFSYLKLLSSFQQIVFHLKEENLNLSVQQTTQIFESFQPCLLNFIICHIIYSAFFSQRNKFDIYIEYLLLIQSKEEKTRESSSQIIKIFIKYISSLSSKEADYIINDMIEHNLLNSKTIQNDDPYFVHYMKKDDIKKFDIIDDFTRIFENTEELSKNNFELHKKLIKEGVNPDEIAKIIRNDEIEKLQEISSKSDFDFNQTIEPILYERYTLTNNYNVTLIDYAAFFSSVKCFKYLLMNGSKIDNTGKYAVAGGNEEIIHLCEQNHSTFNGAYETAIELHQNDIFYYLYENKIEEIKTLEQLGCVCISHDNYEIFSFLLQEGMKINDDIINKAVREGNIILIKYFHEFCQLPKYILVDSAQSGNIELVKYVIEQKVTDDINIKNEIDSIYFT